MIPTWGLLIGFGIGVFLASWKYSYEFEPDSDGYKLLTETAQIGFWVTILGFVFLIYGG